MWPELEVALMRAWGAAGTTVDEQDDEDLGHAFIQPTAESVSSASSGILDAMPTLSPSLPGQIPMLHTSLADAPALAPNPHNPHWSDSFPLPPTAMSLPLQLSQGLGNPPRSIAGFLEWICANYTMTLWRETRAGGFTSRVEDLVMQNMASNYSTVNDDPISAAMVNRINSYHDSYGPPRIQGIEALADRYDTLRLQAVDTLDRRGWWKTPRDIEEQIQSMSQPEELEQMQACMDGRSNDPIMTLSLTRLYVGLCRNFVRFPEGPRWNTMYVTVATGLFRRVIRNEVSHHHA